MKKREWLHAMIPVIIVMSLLSLFGVLSLEQMSMVVSWTIAGILGLWALITIRNTWYVMSDSFSKVMEKPPKKPKIPKKTYRVHEDDSIMIVKKPVICSARTLDSDRTDRVFGRMSDALKSNRESLDRIESRLKKKETHTTPKQHASIEAFVEELHKQEQEYHGTAIETK